MTANYETTAELVSGLRQAILPLGDDGALLLAALDRLNATNRIRLDPTRTDFDSEFGIIRMSNSVINTYGEKSTLSVALNWLFAHELAHANQAQEIKEQFASAIQVNSREYSMTSYYRVEALALVEQYINAFDFGLTVPPVDNAQFRAFYNETVAYFRSHDLSWSAARANLVAEMTTQMRSANLEPERANHYADQAETISSEPALGVIVSELDFSGLPTYFNSLPDFSYLEIEADADGRVSVTGFDSDGNSVWRTDYQTSESSWPPKGPGDSDSSGARATLPLAPLDFGISDMLTGNDVPEYSGQKLTANTISDRRLTLTESVAERPDHGLDSYQSTYTKIALLHHMQVEGHPQ